MKKTCFLALVLTCAMLTGTAQANDMDSMKEMAKSFTEAWNKHDAHALAATFADEADVINPSGRTAKGKTEIEKMFTDEQSTFMKDSHMDLKVESVRVVDGLALSDGTATVTGMVGPGGKKMPKMDHHAFWVSEKSGDTWKIVSLRPYVFAKLPKATTGKQ